MTPRACQIRRPAAARDLVANLEAEDFDAFGAGLSALTADLASLPQIAVFQNLDGINRGFADSVGNSETVLRDSAALLDGAGLSDDAARLVAVAETLAGGDVEGAETAFDDILDIL